jgi:hypothetical protein
MVSLNDVSPNFFGMPSFAHFSDQRSAQWSRAWPERVSIALAIFHDTFERLVLTRTALVQACIQTLFEGGCGPLN